MAPSAVTTQYNDLLSTTLNNYRRTLEDNISKNNAFLWHLKNKVANGYELTSDIGDRMQVPLLYELGQADAYSGYDVLDVTPMDGITSAFWDWRQASVPIAISALEEKKNAGEARILSLLEAKTKQAEMGIQEFFNQRFLQGAGSSSITSAYTSSVTGASFVDPLPKLVAYDPTASVSVGNINQLTYSWWRNRTSNSTAGTYATWFRELRVLHMLTTRGPGGGPDLHILDENVYTLYESGLAASHRNPSYQKADIPFDNIAFHQKPAIHDEYVPDVQGGSATVSTTSGTWWMLNMQFMKVKVHSGTNFSPTTFKTPENQDAKVAHILWLGGTGTSNRRKQGVMGGIDTTITS